MQIDFVKVQRVDRKITVNRVRVVFLGFFGFAKVRRFFFKLPSVECVSISLKFKGYFVKIDIYKVWRLFCKIVICGLRVNFTKVRDIFFAKFTSLTVSDRRSRKF